MKRVRPLVLLKKPASQGLGQRVSPTMQYITGGGKNYRPGGPADNARILSAITEDENGDPCSRCITLTLSQCVYWQVAVDYPIAAFFSYRLSNPDMDSSQTIATSNATVVPPDNGPPMFKKWTITFETFAISSARSNGGGGTEDVWLEGDIITMGYDQSSPLLISPDCSTTSEDDKPLDIIVDFPVVNVYAPPYLVSAEVG